MDDLIAKALHAARQHFENGGDASVIPPEFTSDTAGEPVDFRPLNFDALRQANAVRVTHRANPDGSTDPDPETGFSIVSGWNDSMAGHDDPRSTVTWPNNPKAYGVVSDMFANNPEWITPHKYRQIVHSARELGMRDEDVYAQPRADGGHVDAALHMLRHHLAGGGLLSGPDYLSTGEEVSPTNWGNPDVASDFFKADKALRLAREIQAKADAEVRRPPIPDRVVEEAPALPRAALRVAAEPSPQMAAMLARAETEPGKIEGRAAPEVDRIAARAPQGPELTDRDRDLIIRTIAAETSGKTPEESQAIAHVILNRIQSGKFGANPEAVLFAKKQFEPWSNPAGANYPMRFLPDSRRYGMGQAALEAALSGDDITGGALNFWGPKAQAALGRKAPDWAAEMPDYSDIGETRFHRPRADGGEVDAAPEEAAAPDEVEKALNVVRRQPVTPASMARAWTPPEKTIAQNVGPRASEFMQQYPEKLAAGIAAAPGEIAHSIADPFALARQAYEGQLPPNYFHSDEGMGRILNAAMIPQLGGIGGAPARAGETVLGSGPVRKALDVAAQQPRELSPLGFYSHGAETALGLPQAKGTPEQFAGMLQKYGVKPAEMEGFGEAFAGRPSVTRDEIAAHFKERMPQIEETVLRDRKFKDVNEAQAAVDAALERGDMAAAELLHRDWEAQFQGNTKFGQYTLPGGENYREVLLKMPSDAKAPTFEQWYEKTHIKPLENYADNPRMMEMFRNKYDAEVKNMPKEVNFKSSHWDDPNVLAHLRMADRTGPNGEKILHVEEIQSDWGQKGKKEGFVTKYKPEDIKEIDPANITSERRRNEFWNFETPTGAIDVPKNSRWPTIEAARQHILDNVKPTGVPTAPYVTNTQAWTDLALKRALREAAESGYDKLVWTPGAEQAKRYDLSKQIDALQYVPASEKIYAYKNGQLVINKAAKPEELEGLVGKDVAKKLLATEPQVGSYGNPAHYLAGQDLSVGGEGMKGYYDKIVPNQLSKLVKKLDPEAKIGRDSIGSGKYEVVLPNGKVIAEYPEKVSADIIARKQPGATVRQNGLEVPSLTITPKMREAILKGQTAFKNGGSVEDRALMLVSKQA
jgi:spore germination cell wall hydrolase CwlJ-like protein